MEQNKKTRILLVAERKDEFYEWISSILSKEFAVEEFYQHSYFFKPPSLLKRFFLVISNYNKLIKEFKPDKLLVYGKALTSIWLFVFLIRFFRLNIEIIVFRYDIEHFRPYLDGFKSKIENFIARKLEKFCLVHSDKIVHKGLINELQFLRFYGRIKNKPHYLFRGFVNPRLVESYNANIKLSKEDKHFHLVVVGALPLQEVTYSESLWEFYPKITNQKIHLHLYMNLDNQTENKLKKIQSENPFFHYKGYINRGRLLKEIAKYDYGLFVTAWNKGNLRKNYFTMTAIGSRIFDYISAHLPIISSDDALAANEIIDNFKIGFHIPFKKIYSLKQALIRNKKDYIKTVKNIDKAVGFFSDYGDFISFIKS